MTGTDGTSVLTANVRRALGRAKVAAEPSASNVLLPVHLAHLKRTRLHTDVAIFLTPLSPGGGVISLFELLSTSRRIGLALGFDSRMAYQSGHFPRRHHPQGGAELLTSVDAVLNCYRDASRIWFHVPEYQFLRHMPRYVDRLNDMAMRGADVVVNILNQNIRMMPDPAQIDAVCADARYRLTVTTAHHTYCRPSLQQQYGMPWHHISTWVTPEDYSFGRYRDDRCHRLVVSPDHSARRSEILAMVRRVDPQLELATVQSMSYEQYLQLVFSSRWSLTFGEGLDGYFVEMGLSGGVPFAVYNPDFFTEDFLTLESVFEDWDDFAEQWPGLFLRLVTDNAYARDTSDAIAALLGRYYDRTSHVDRLARYYTGDFDLR